MKIDLINTRILITKKITFNNYSKYDKVYAFTNENIDGYMNKLDFKNKENSLCVMASGDHMLNLVLYGIKTIDTFDINKLTEYYVLGLKTSAIITFNYYEFINFMNKITNPNTSLQEINDLINLIIPNMDKKYRTYFKNLLKYYSKISNNNLFSYLLNDSHQLEGYMVNTYLKNEQNYNLLKYKLKEVNITFTNCDITELPNFNKQYDFIFLSNILDYLFNKYGNYWNYSKLQELEKSFLPLLNIDGVLALHYIYNYFYKHSNRYKEILINSSSIHKDNLTNESIITFEHVYNNQIDKNISAGLMLVKKH